MYYSDKVGSLEDIFGAQGVRVEAGSISVSGKRYPVLNDVIILLDPAQYPDSVKRRLSLRDSGEAVKPREFAEDIQDSFGREWRSFPDILPEHGKEFKEYFDLIAPGALQGKRVCDLGCGIGRWSYFLRDQVRELVLVDFSEAIFVAKENLKDAGHCLFFMADLQRLPFRDGFADFLFCLGVLHHLPTDALQAVRALKKYAPEILIFIYYALDNRPFYFRWLLPLVTAARSILARIKSPGFRSVFSWLGAVFLYLPLVGLGWLLKPLGLSRQVPLYEGYRGKSLKRIRQDVYDRFFTRLEQRFTKKEILLLQDTFSTVAVSEGLPYWHFLLRA